MDIMQTQTVDIMQIERIGYSSCESQFKVWLGDGRIECIRLWIITGGTPCLAFADYSYSRRFPVVERFSNANWTGYGYKHQNVDPRTLAIDPATAIGLDVLPDGLESVRAWFADMLPRRTLRDQRLALLPPVYEIRSRRLHDTENRTYVWAHVDIRSCGVSPVCGYSVAYAGRMNGDESFIPAIWHEAQAILKPLADRSIAGEYMPDGWEGLSESEFESVRAALWTLYNSRDTTGIGRRSVKVQG